MRGREVGGPEADRVVSPDDGVETVADSGRVEYRTGRGREGLPAVMAVAHQEPGAASMAEENSGPVAR